MKLENNIEKAVTWLTGGGVDGKPTPGVHYHCQITVDDTLDEVKNKVSILYDFPDVIIDDKTSEEVIKMGNERLLNQLKEKLEENELA
jgi:hypothetical protein